MVLAAASKHPDLRELVIEINKRLKLNDPIVADSNDSLEGIIRQLQEEQVLRQRYNKSQSSTIRAFVAVGKAQLCYKYLETGKCSFGDKCKYEHRDGGKGKSTTQAAPPKGPTPTNTTTRDNTCQSLKRWGKCLRKSEGKECPFDHPELPRGQRKRAKARLSKMRKADMSEAPPPGLISLVEEL